MNVGNEWQRSQASDRIRGLIGVFLFRIVNSSRSPVQAVWMLVLFGTCLPAQRMASTYANLQSFIDVCPQNDPYTPIIRRDFRILRDQAAVGDIPCTEPYSQMPV